MQKEIIYPQQESAGRTPLLTPLVLRRRTKGDGRSEADLQAANCSGNRWAASAHPKKRMGNGMTGGSLRHTWREHGEPLELKQCPYESDNYDSNKK